MSISLAQGKFDKCLGWLLAGGQGKCTEDKVHWLKLFSTV